MNTICLLVRVHRGGQYWQECLTSMKPLFDSTEPLFHEIVFSFSKNEFQSEDVAAANLILGLTPQLTTKVGLKIICQEVGMSAVRHHLEVMKEGIIKSDFVFHLCHDDLLQIDGVRDLVHSISSLSERSVAAVGPFSWSETKESIAGTTRQLSRFQDGVTREEFVERDLTIPFYFSLSGICAPSRQFRKHLKYYSLFERGFRFDHLLVTGPGITRIFQLSKPTVWVRLHDAQDGSQRTAHEFLEETLTYFIIQFFTLSGVALRAKLLYRILLIARPMPLLAMRRALWTIRSIRG